MHVYVHVGICGCLYDISEFRHVHVRMHVCMCQYMCVCVSPLTIDSGAEWGNTSWGPLAEDRPGVQSLTLTVICPFQSVQALIADFQGTPTFTYKAAHIFFTDSECG